MIESRSSSTRSAPSVGVKYGDWLHVVLGEEREQVADLLHRLGAPLGHEVGHTRDPGVGPCAPQLLEGDLLAGDCLDHIGPGDEQMAGAFDLEHEVGDRRRIDRPPCTWPHDHRYLWDHPRGSDVSLEDPPVPVQRGHSLLDAGPARVLEPDHRDPHLEGHVHDLADLVRYRPAQAPAEHREVLGEDEHGPPVDGAPSGYHRVAGRAGLLDAKAARLVADEHVDLFERALVEQQLDPLAGGQLPLLVLTGYGSLAACVQRLVAQAAQLLDPLLGAHLVPFRDSGIGPRE